MGVDIGMGQHYFDLIRFRGFGGSKFWPRALCWPQPVTEMAVRLLEVVSKLQVSWDYERYAGAEALGFCKLQGFFRPFQTWRSSTLTGLGLRDYLLQVGSCIVHSAWVNPSDHMRPHCHRVPTRFTRRARGIAGGSHPQLVQSGSLRARGLCLSAGGWRVVEGDGLRSQGTRTIWDRWPLPMGSIFLFGEFIRHTLRLGTY